MASQGRRARPGVSPGRAGRRSGLGVAAGALEGGTLGPLPPASWGLPNPNSSRIWLNLTDSHGEKSQRRHGRPWPLSSPTGFAVAAAAADASAAPLGLRRPVANSLGAGCPGSVSQAYTTNRLQRRARAPPPLELRAGCCAAVGGGHTALAQGRGGRPAAGAAQAAIGGLLRRRQAMATLQYRSTRRRQTDGRRLSPLIVFAQHAHAQPSTITCSCAVRNTNSFLRQRRRRNQPPIPRILRAAERRGTCCA